MDICAGRSEIERCSTKMAQQLAKVLDCTMEDIMELSSPCDGKAGLLKDEDYFECDLPPFLTTSIETMKKVQAKLNRGEECYDRDRDFCDLQSGINVVG